ncbi:MAG: hypothetical protein ACSHW0_01855 [Thalassotalea sp.]
MRIILLTLLLSLTTFANGADWVTNQLLEGKIFIDFPSTVKIKEETQGKVVLDNKSGLAKFTFQQTNIDADVKTIKQIHKAISAKYHKGFPDANWSKDKVINKFETKVFILEFENKSVRSDSYNIIYGIPLNGKLLLVSYNSLENEAKKKWRNIAREAFDTLELE